MLVKFVPRFFNHPAYVGAMIIWIGIFSLGFAFISQYGFGYHPCELCIYQRWPYGLVIAFGALALFLSAKKPKFTAIIIAFSSFIFFIGMAIAFFHVGVEQKWWEGLSGCSTPDFLNDTLSMEELEKLINNAPTVKCGDIAWSLFGLSMAAYNVILSFAYGIYCILAAIFVTRRANGL